MNTETFPYTWVGTCAMIAAAAILLPVIVSRSSETSPLAVDAYSRRLILDDQNQLRFEVTVRNNSRQHVELQKVEVDFGCRAEFRSSDLPLLIRSGEKRIVDGGLAVDEEYFCPITQASCDHRALLRLIYRDSRGGRPRITDAWNLQTEFRRSFSVSRSRLTFQGNDWQRAGGSSSRGIVFRHDPGVRINRVDLGDVSSGLSSDWERRTNTESHIRVCCVDDTPAGAPATEIRIEGTGPDGGFQVRIPVYVNPFNRVDVIPGTLLFTDASKGDDSVVLVRFPGDASVSEVFRLDEHSCYLHEISSLNSDQNFVKIVIEPDPSQQEMFCGEKELRFRCVFDTGETADFSVKCFDYRITRGDDFTNGSGYRSRDASKDE